LGGAEREAGRVVAVGRHLGGSAWKGFGVGLRGVAGTCYNPGLVV
jgi:hypothetical protein